MYDLSYRVKLLIFCLVRWGEVDGLTLTVVQGGAESKIVRR